MSSEENGYCWNGIGEGLPLHGEGEHSLLDERGSSLLGEGKPPFLGEGGTSIPGEG